MRDDFEDMLSDDGSDVANNHDDRAFVSRLGCSEVVLLTIALVLAVSAVIAANFYSLP